MHQPSSVASLAMYPFPALRPATNELWRAVRTHLGWGPEELEWTVLTPDVWRHPDLLLAQTCGWPLVTELADVVVVIGAFDYDIPDAEHGTYRSVIVTPHEATFEQVRDMPGVVAAINRTDSLSGWISLRHAWGGQPVDVLETGAHLESVRALAQGRADIASIDAASWALMRDVVPELVRKLHVVAAGPRVPCLPLVAGDRHAADLPSLRAAFAAAIADPSAAAACATLRIRGFQPYSLADYLPLLSLVS